MDSPLGYLLLASDPLIYCYVYKSSVFERTYEPVNAFGGVSFSAVYGRAPEAGHCNMVKLEDLDHHNALLEAKVVMHPTLSSIVSYMI